MGHCLLTLPVMLTCNRVDTSESVLVIVSQATQRHHLFTSHDQHEAFHLVYCVVMVFVCSLITTPMYHPGHRQPLHGIC